MIVAKAVNMAEKMNVPILGIVENMSYIECPDCGKKIEVFGKSKLPEVAERYNLDILGQLPINPALAEACDKGEVEDPRCRWHVAQGSLCRRGHYPARDRRGLSEHERLL